MVTKESDNKDYLRLRPLLSPFHLLRPQDSAFFFGDTPGFLTLADRNTYIHLTFVAKVISVVAVIPNVFQTRIPLQHQ